MARSLGSPPRKTDNGAGAIDSELLRRHVDRLIRLMDERDAIGEDIKEVYAEAKDAGFVTAVLRQQVKEQRMDPETLQAHLAMMDAYRDALGQLADTPLGKAGEPIVSRGAQAERQPKRKPKVQAAMEAAQAHLSGAAAREQRMEDDLDRIIDDSAGTA